MANIKVNHSKFEAAADAVESHVSTIRKKMKQADVEVITLVNDWQGDDYAQFLTRWNAIDEKGSVCEESVKALEGYAEFLRFAAEKYKKTQASAVNRANNLPRY